MTQARRRRPIGQRPLRRRRPGQRPGRPRLAVRQRQQAPRRLAKRRRAESRRTESRRTESRRTESRRTESRRAQRRLTRDRRMRIRRARRPHRPDRLARQVLSRPTCPPRRPAKRRQRVRSQGLRRVRSQGLRRVRSQVLRRPSQARQREDRGQPRRGQPRRSQVQRAALPSRPRPALGLQGPERRARRRQGPRHRGQGRYQLVRRVRRHPSRPRPDLRPPSQARETVYRRHAQGLARLAAPRRIAEADEHTDQE
jgi:hypothetical protein